MQGVNDMGINKTIIIGNLVRDVELKYTSTGKAVASMSIAYNDGYGEKKEVSYFDIQVWDKQAEHCGKYLKKGSMVAIEGKLIQQRWTDKTTNQARSKVIINANSVQFLDAKDYNKPQGQASGLTKEYQQEDPWDDTKRCSKNYDDDISF
jgi:single-strand DNA-binding protein